MNRKILAASASIVLIVASFMYFNSHHSAVAENSELLIVKVKSEKEVVRNEQTSPSRPNQGSVNSSKKAHEEPTKFSPLIINKPKNEEEIFAVSTEILTPPENIFPITVEKEQLEIVEAEEIITIETKNLGPLDYVVTEAKRHNGSISLLGQLKGDFHEAHEISITWRQGRLFGFIMTPTGPLNLITIRGESYLFSTNKDFTY